jgi:chromosome segregation ATPase
MAAAAGATTFEAKRKPGWMSMTGGPKEPNLAEFRTKFSALVDQKKKCFDELKAIRAEFDAARGDDGEKTAIDKERFALRDKISKIDGDRKKERDARRGADDKIRQVRQERRDVEKQLDQLTQEVGAFSDISEIDEAIDLVMFKLETGTASLSAEKQCIKRLAKLEEAKALLQKLAPLEEAIADAEERELDLQQESRDIHSRIAALNNDYEKNLAAKIEKDKERSKTTVDFSALFKRRETVSKQIDELNAQIDELRGNFDKAQDAWREWRVTAQEKYAAKLAAEREERERAWREKENARKLERRRSKAQKKLNPHKVEIEVCATLIGYLEQKVKIHQREVEEAEKRKKLATFDAAAAAPKGAVVANATDDDWLFADRSKKTQKQAPKPQAKEAGGAKKDTTADLSKDSKKKAIHHSGEKQNQFAQIKIDAPSTYGDIDAVLKELKNRKKEYESKIVLNPDDVEVSDSDEEVEGGEVADDATNVASTAAPVAAE